ncbi:hypothetical protein TGMAS_232800 [Toxoplasma gondii MAS]|uniref:Uncharacterized protein n=1 Tax=Toxoplasma gondii MAS TaxID=943118 RepID=A0A086QXH2_TOXGO|nr:hypothetical protein TGMAS_232800 [Toxoplasma gondii MAS]
MADSGPVSSTDRPVAASAQGSARNATSTKEGSPSARSSTISSSASAPNDGNVVAGGNTGRTDSKGSTASADASAPAGSAVSASSGACAGKKAGAGETLQKGTQKGSSSKHGGSTSSKSTGGGSGSSSWKNGTSCQSSKTSGSHGSSGQGNQKNSSSGQKHGNESSQGGSSSAKKDVGGFDSELSARELRKIKYYEEMFARLANEERQKQGTTVSSSSSSATGGTGSSSGSSEKQSKKGGTHRADGSGGASSKAGASGASRSEGSTKSQDTQPERNSVTTSPGAHQAVASQPSGSVGSRGSGGGGTKRKHNRVIDSSDDEGPPASPRPASHKRVALSKGGSASEPVAAVPSSSVSSGGSSRALSASSGGMSDSQKKAEKDVSRQPGGPAAADTSRGVPPAGKASGKSDSGVGPRQVPRDAPSSLSNSKPQAPHSSGASAKGHGHAHPSSTGSASTPNSRLGFKESDWGWKGRGSGGDPSRKKQRAAVAAPSSRGDEEDSSSSSSSGSSSSSSSGSSDSSEGESTARSKIGRSKDIASRGSDVTGAAALASTRAKRLALAPQRKRQQASFGGSGGYGGADEFTRRAESGASASSAPKSEKKATSASQHPGGEGVKKLSGANAPRVPSSSAGSAATSWASAGPGGKSAPQHQRPTSAVADQKSGADPGSRDESASKAGSPRGGDGGGAARSEKKVLPDEMRRKSVASSASGWSLASSKGSAGFLGTGDASHSRPAFGDSHAGEEGLRPASRVLVKGEKQERASSSSGRTTGSVKQEKDQTGGIISSGSRAGGDGSVVPPSTVQEKNPWGVEGAASCSRDQSTDGGGVDDSHGAGAPSDVTKRRGPSPLGNESLAGPGCPPGDSSLKKAEGEGRKGGSRSRSTSPSGMTGAEASSSGVGKGSKGGGTHAGSVEKGSKDNASASLTKETQTAGRADGACKGAAGGAAPGRQTAGKRGNTGRSGGLGCGVMARTPVPDSTREGQTSSSASHRGSELAGRSQLGASSADNAYVSVQSRSSQTTTVHSKRTLVASGSGNESAAGEEDAGGRAGRREVERATASTGSGRSAGGAVSSNRGARQHQAGEGVEDAIPHRSGGSERIVSETESVMQAGATAPSGGSKAVRRTPAVVGESVDGSASGGSPGAAERTVTFSHLPVSSDSPAGAGGPAPPHARGPKLPAAAYRVSPLRPLQGLYRQIPAGGPEAGEDDENVLSPPLPLLAVARSLASQPSTSTPLPPASLRQASSPSSSVQSREAGAGSFPWGSLTEAIGNRQKDESSKRAGPSDPHTTYACRNAVTATGGPSTQGTGSTSAGAGDRSELYAPLTPAAGSRVGMASYQLVEESTKSVKSCGQTAFADSSNVAGSAGATFSLPSDSSKEYAEACCNVVPTRDWRRLLLGSGEGTQEEKVPGAGPVKSTPASSSVATCVKSSFDKRPSTSDAESNAEVKQGFAIGEPMNKASASAARPREPSHLPLPEGVQQPLPLNGRWLTSLSWKAQLLRKVYNAGRS